jgi:hypothetical protein
MIRFGISERLGKGQRIFKRAEKGTPAKRREQRERVAGILTTDFKDFTDGNAYIIVIRVIGGGFPVLDC